MAEAKNEARTLNWYPILVAAVIAFVVSIVIGICAIDMSLFLNIFIVAPTLVIMSVALPLYAVVRNRSSLPTIAVTLAVSWAIPVSVFLYNRAHPFELRETARWLVWSQQYKREVLRRAPSANGNLKHIEWDVTGFARIADNTLYLVFDPADTLSAAAHKNKPDKPDVFLAMYGSYTASRLTGTPFSFIPMRRGNFAVLDRSPRERIGRSLHPVRRQIVSVRFLCVSAAKTGDRCLPSC